MPKKGAAKQPKAGEKAEVKAASSSAAAAAADEEEHEAPKSYLDAMSPEELKKEVEKIPQRVKKASEQETKQQDDVWDRQDHDKIVAKKQREEARDKAKVEKYSAAMRKRALAEGVLESQDGGDDIWYVDMGGGIWKEVKDCMWCRHCEANLNESNLEPHLESDKHKKRLAWADPAASAAAASRAPPPSRPGTSSAAAVAPSNGALEEWQEQLPDGSVRCTLCNRLCDGNHELTDAHRRHYEGWLYNKASANIEYPAPAQPWLAWVHQPDFGEGKYLKCLLCEKWVQDYELMPGQTDTTGYNGKHGAPSSSNQKDHARKVAHYSCYAAPIAAARAEYHPVQRPTPSQQAQRPAGPATPAPWATKAAAAAPAATARPPAGWQAIWSEDLGRYYYYNEALQETRWELPTVPAAPPPAAKATSAPAAPSSASKAQGAASALGKAPAAAAPAAPKAAQQVPAPPQVPAGWTAQWNAQHQRYYFHNAAMQRSTWELPVAEASAAAAEDMEEV